jgi:hypothetical protein
MLDWYMDELERIWKVATVAWSKYYSAICLECLREIRETSVRIANVPAEIRNEYLPNTRLARYRSVTRR